MKRCAMLMWRSTDFLWHVLGSSGELGTITLTCACEFRKMFLCDGYQPGGFGAAGASHDSPRTPNVHI